METYQKDPIDRTARVASSSNNMMIYTEPPTRNSMDLIEGTSQQFPQGMKKPEIDAHVQRQRWDAFFEPQYSFGAFIHGLNKEEEDQQKQQHQKKIDRLVDDGNFLLEPSIKSPKVVERASYDFGGSNTENSSAAMTPTLPNLSDNANGKEAWGPRDEKTLIERLELLKKMRAQPTLPHETEEYALDGEDTGKKIKEEAAKHTARWKRHLSEKAKQLCKEAKDDDTNSTATSLDPDEKIVQGGDEEEAVDGKKYACRRSFLCFLLGFIFPPLWLFGAFYFSSHASKQTSASRRIDRIWRRRSRIAFGIFTISLMIILVIIFVLKPGSVGWRLSSPRD